ncbi:MAG: hypothetical protein GX206_09365 [Clostridiales bacterium]|nr:hypothetical protein [Clostridiales bacterium]
MAKVIGTNMFTLNKQCKCSSSVSKCGNYTFDGRSASIFRKSTNYSIIP